MSVLSDYSVSLSYRRLSANVVHEVKRRVIDTLGCAMGCYDMEPPAIARAHAVEAVSTPGSTVLGTRHQTTPEMAAFANGVMARYLDFNDTSIAGNAGHPSDNIPALLAIAEYIGADMQDTIAGIVVAYEVHGRVGAVCSDVINNGWDQGVYVVLASAAGAGRILGLNKDQMANALALAAIPNAAMGEVRVGELSMWKGCAGANAARNGVFAALLARRGMTGPAEAFEGPRGLKKQLGTPLRLSEFGGNDIPFTIEKDKYKYFPCDYEAQCSITPALELHKEIKGKIDGIERIDIETYARAVHCAADTRDKWNPTTRETADHSIPYVVAVALSRGTLWFDDFSEDRIRDPRILALMQDIHVTAIEDYTKDWPQAYPFRITATMKSGLKHVQEVRYAKGHPQNPLSDQEIEIKFRKLAEPVMGKLRANVALDQLWRLETMHSAREVLNLFALD